MGGVQSQYAPSSYIGLWTRLERFERSQLTRALERRTIVQGTLMRGTIHLVTAGDYWPLAAGIRQDSRTWWLGATRHQISEREMVAVARRARSLFADGPRRRKDLIAELGVTSTVLERRRRVAQPPARPAVGDVGTALGRPLRRGGGLADETRPTRRSTKGSSCSSAATSADSVRHRARTSRAGRASRSPPSPRRSSGCRCGGSATSDGGELLDLPRAPLPGADVPAPVRFLPTWDATLLVHARRTQILPERLPTEALQHEDPAFVPLLPGGRAGRGHVEARRGPRRGVAVRAVAASRAAGRRRRGTAARGLARVTVRSRGGRRSAPRPPAA